jgi:hypothetical protein
MVELQNVIKCLKEKLSWNKNSSADNKLHHSALWEPELLRPF